MDNRFNQRIVLFLAFWNQHWFIVSQRAHRAFESKIAWGFEVVGLAVKEVAEEAAIDEALDVFGVADDWRERLVPAWGFFGFRDDIAFKIMLFVEEIPEA